MIGSPVSPPSLSICERTERWKRERVIEVSSHREHLEQEERRLEAVVERLLDQVESGTSVGLRLKQRQAELDAVRVKLAEPVAVDLDEDQFKAALSRTAQWLRWHGPTINPGDVAQTRAAMRQLGIDKIAITPTETGWTFAGDGNLAGVIGLSRRSPRFPPGRAVWSRHRIRWRRHSRRSNSGRHSLARGITCPRSRDPGRPRPIRYARRFFAKKSVQRFQASAAAAAL